MSSEPNSFIDKRKHERKTLQKEAVYELNGSRCPCHIVDVSSEGIGMRVKGFLAKGDFVVIFIGTQVLNSTVVRVDGNIIGVMFDTLNTDQLNYILGLQTSEL